jgi:hypothetical protein
LIELSVLLLAAFSDLQKPGTGNSRIWETEKKQHELTFLPIEIGLYKFILKEEVGAKLALLLGTSQCKS